MIAKTDAKLVITVTAAIIIKDNAILAARRQYGSHMAGYWEFPGGKLEPGESEEQCLLRELQEEFNVKCSIERFFMESVFDYGTKKIKLRSYIASHLSGTFECRVHDALTWLPVQHLDSLNWAPADLPIVEKILREDNILPEN